MKKYGLYLYLYVFATISAVSISAMQDTPTRDVAHPQLYVIPGQNGCGCEDWHVRKILGSRDVEVPTPTVVPDLGQNQCLSLLRNALKAHPEHKDIIVYAVSQGTATVLNYLAETSDPRIKCIVLQAPLASGNSAILHTLGGPLMNFPRLASLPFAHYWIPYCAKVMFPLYWPAGKQPIKSAQIINCDIPIVISHAKNDPQLPYEGACALYYSLKAHGKKNVYLLSKENTSHMWLLDSNDKPTIDAILAKHDLKEKDPEAAVDLSLYQPDHTQFKVYYDNLVYKEKNHTRLKYAAITTIATTAMYLLRNRITPVFSKVAPLARTALNWLHSNIGGVWLGASRLFSFTVGS